MKALRIKLHQTSANYRKEETITNKMTYPLPPLSTIIGALHNICGYTEYREMRISIQGKYGSLRKKVYTDYCFLNSLMNDRGTLVKMKNESLLSNAFTKVASAKKSQGNDFFKGITIQVYDEELLEEYRSLKRIGNEIATLKKSDEYKEKQEYFKSKKAELAKRKKEIGKGNDGYDEVVEEDKKIKQEEKDWKNEISEYERVHYKEPFSKFKSLTTSVKSYEILDDIELILHVQAEEKILDDIMENIDNLQCLGRSEDFVDVKEAVVVDLGETDEEVESSYSAYLKYTDLKEEKIQTESRGNREIFGTKYYLGKKYEIQKGKRNFVERVPVVYTSEYFIEETSENVWIDEDENTTYIVNFL